MEGGGQGPGCGGWGTPGRVGGATGATERRRPHRRSHENTQSAAPPAPGPGTRNQLAQTSRFLRKGGSRKRKKELPGESEPGTGLQARSVTREAGRWEEGPASARRERQERGKEDRSQPSGCSTPGKPGSFQASSRLVPGWFQAGTLVWF